MWCDSQISEVLMVYFFSNHVVWFLYLWKLYRDFIHHLTHLQSTGVLVLKTILPIFLYLEAKHLSKFYSPLNAATDSCLYLDLLWLDFTFADADCVRRSKCQCMIFNVLSIEIVSSVSSLSFSSGVSSYCGFASTFISWKQFHIISWYVHANIITG